jgi:AcrR family transcriptional regulator
MAETGDNTRPSRAPAGAAVLQTDVTEAIRQAFFAELAECGYGRLAIEAVARRAAVGKPAIYRRWRSKQDMAVALISEVAWAHLDMPDTGSLLGDVIAFLRAEYEALTYPLAKAIIPDLLSEANRNPALEAALLLAVRDPRRTRAAKSPTRSTLTLHWTYWPARCIGGSLLYISPYVMLRSWSTLRTW